MCKVKLSYFFLGCDHKKHLRSRRKSFFTFFCICIFLIIFLFISQFQAWPLPGQTPRKFFERANSPPPGHKESAKPLSLGQKNRARTQPWGQLFSKFQQNNTKHETEIMKNSTEMLICLEILKQWNIKQPEALSGWLLWIFRISQIILHSSINQHKKFIWQANTKIQLS